MRRRSWVGRWRGDRRAAARGAHEGTARGGSGSRRPAWLTSVRAPARPTGNSRSRCSPSSATVAPGQRVGPGPDRVQRADRQPDPATAPVQRADDRLALRHPREGEDVAVGEERPVATAGERRVAPAQVREAAHGREHPRVPGVRRPGHGAAVVRVLAPFEPDLVAVVDARHPDVREERVVGGQERVDVAAHAGEEARDVVRGEQVELGERDRPRQPCPGAREAAVELRGVAALRVAPEVDAGPEGEHRAQEAGVVHGGVLLVALQPSGRVEEVLAQDVGVGALRADRAAHRRHVVVVARGPRALAEHVDHVEAPAVDRPRRPQPAPQDRVLALVHLGAHAGAGEVEHREGAHAGPPDVAIGVGGVGEDVVVAGRRRGAGGDARRAPPRTRDGVRWCG